MKAIAAGYKVPAEPNDKGETVDDKGKPLTRPGIPADHFPPPFANEQAARTRQQGGALPPDLSIIVKARDGGPEYVYSIVTGFHQKPPAGFTVLPNKYYNPYFNGWNISMPPPLAPNSGDLFRRHQGDCGAEAHDVVTFLSWAAEPKHGRSQAHRLRRDAVPHRLRRTCFIFPTAASGPTFTECGSAC